MKNYFLLFILFLLFCNSANAQFTIESYPIDQFKLPDIDRRAMEFSGNLIGDFNARSNYYSNHSYTTSQFEPSIGLFYSRYINRTDMQADYFVSMYPDVVMRNTRNDFSNQQSRYTAISPNIYFFGERAKYNGLNFTKYGATSSVYFNQYYQTDVVSGSEDKQREHDLNANIEISVGFGTGRLELVSDMAMALFLLNDAIGAGVDRALVSADQVNGFASRMATLRNERVFDTRVKRIHELRELYAFMKENNWTIADDPGFFTVLTDNWLYNFNVSRLSGKKWTYEFIPSYQFSGRKSTFNNEDPFTSSSHTLGGELQVLFEKYKPVNVHHDIFRTHSIRTGVIDYINDADHEEYDYEAFQAGFTTTFGRQWIPNSRTTVRASILFDYQFTHPFSFNAQIPDDDHLINTALTGTANYFISYRTRLFADFSMSYAYHNNGDNIVVHFPFDVEEVNSGFHVRLSGGVTVSIF